MLIRVDVYEARGELFVEAELPGIRARGVEVLLNDGVLTIRGRRAIDESSGLRFHCRERGRLAFERHVPLPFEVSREATRASLRDGVLTVRLPRAESLSEKETCVPVH
jgi:HSP20 family protein